jgi:hypothetical protein
MFYLLYYKNNLHISCRHTPPMESIMFLSLLDWPLPGKRKPAKKSKKRNRAIKKYSLKKKK